MASRFQAELVEVLLGAAVDTAGWYRYMVASTFSTSFVYE